MKRICIILAIIFGLSAAASAAPAYPYPIKVRQPDGSYITIQLHGDEFCNWATSGDCLVWQDSDGWWRSSAPLSAGKAAPNSISLHRAAVARAERDRIMRAAASPWAKGSGRFLIILVEFSDLSFTIPNPQQAFSDLLNKEGYSDNGGTGSARDYFYENSRGAFNPTFDVVGPVKISGTMADYGGRTGDASGYGSGADKNARGIVEACDSLFKHGTVTFSDYDNDHDGTVDCLFFYYAGHNEAEGGGADTIWPHASYFTGAYARTYGGVKLGPYSCTSEYKGSEGNVMCGIGTFCHEFSHRLGLPDFYDTDYEENGENFGLDKFSLMSSGNYNNAGRTPPYMTAIERGMLGWMGSPTSLTSNGNYTLQGVQENAAYVSPTDNEGEYYLYETRTGTGWDSWIKWDGVETEAAMGMVVYHIDQSDNKIDGITAKKRWEDWNGINNYAIHPCMYIKFANPNAVYYGDIPFPGYSNVTEFSDMTNPAMKSWDGESTGYALSDIAFADGKTTFTLTIDQRRMVIGTVRDSAGEPVEGAQVSLTDAASSSAQQHLAKGKLSSQLVIRRLASHVVTTGEDGKFSIELGDEDGQDLILMVSKSGYRTYNLNFKHSSGKTRKDVVLKRVDEPSTADISKYKEICGYGVGFGDGNVTVGVKFSPEELAPYVGMKISEIQFLFFATGAAQVDAFVDFGDKRVCTKVASSPGFITDKASFSYADMSDAGVVIPADSDVYIGYALKDAVDSRNGTCYPVAIDTLTVDGGGYVKSSYSTSGGGWSTIRVNAGYAIWNCNAIISCTVEDNISPFFAYGILNIINPKPEGYSVGDSFRFALGDVGADVSSVAWYFDDALQDAPSITLSAAGRHKVKAMVVLEDGSTQEIEQIIEVK